MSEHSKRIDALVRCRDGLRMAGDALDDYIQTFAPPAVQNNMPDLDMNVWVPRIGEHGAFDLAEAKANADNASFTRLTEYLTKHDGKATINGYFVWKFGDSSGNIGRKRVKTAFVG
jgi:hypothetical protein